MIAKARVSIPAVMFVVALYLGALGVFVVGYSATALWVFLILTHIRGFGVTAGYHRYLTHRSFRTSRPVQFLLGALGASALVGSPLVWCATHHRHHRYSDGPEDWISPVQHGFWWTQFAVWSFMTPEGGSERYGGYDRYPEMRWLDRFWLLPAAIIFVGLYIAGEWLARDYPQLGTNGPQLLVWGGFLGTVYIYHVTSLVNSWCHYYGARPYETGDNSRNSMLVGILAMGEGWHNNHHRFPYSERQGLTWWQVDVTHYLLVAMSALGLVWDLKTPKTKIEASA